MGSTCVVHFGKSPYHSEPKPNVTTYPGRLSRHKGQGGNTLTTRRHTMKMKRLNLLRVTVVAILLLPSVTAIKELVLWDPSWFTSKYTKLVKEITDGSSADFEDVMAKVQKLKSAADANTKLNTELIDANEKLKRLNASGKGLFARYTDLGEEV